MSEVKIEDSKISMTSSDVKLPMLTIVSVIENNCVKNLYHFYDYKKAEKKFKDLIECNFGSQSKQDFNDAIMDGYFDNDTLCICIGQPE